VPVHDPFFAAEGEMKNKTADDAAPNSNLAQIRITGARQQQPSPCNLNPR
jgi:hypothetical protein